MDNVLPQPLWRNLLIICQFELARLFSTKRGALSLLTLALIWGLLLRYPVLMAADFINDNQAHPGSIALFGRFGLADLLAWPIGEFAVYWRSALFLFPLFCVFLAADQTSSDRDRGTLRFIALRTGRDSIFFGRYLGQMLIQAILVVLTLFTTLLLVLMRDFSQLAVGLEMVLAIGVNMILVLMPFTAMMALISALVPSARQGIIWAILVWTLVAGVLSWLAEQVPLLAFLRMLIPGTQLSELGSLVAWQGLQLAYVPIAQTLVLLLAGRELMRRNAL